MPTSPLKLAALMADEVPSQDDTDALIDAEWGEALAWAMKEGTDATR